jgi:hypothetical protein
MIIVTVRGSSRHVSGIALDEGRVPLECRNLRDSMAWMSARERNRGENGTAIAVRHRRLGGRCGTRTKYAPGENGTAVANFRSTMRLRLSEFHAKLIAGAFAALPGNRAVPGVAALGPVAAERSAARPATSAARTLPEVVVPTAPSVVAPPVAIHSLKLVLPKAPFNVAVPLEKSSATENAAMANAAGA